MLTLGNLMDSSPPGSFIHRILQARLLEWVAISFSNKTDIMNSKVSEMSVLLL